MANPRIRAGIDAAHPDSDGLDFIRSEGYLAPTKATDERGLVTVRFLTQSTRGIYAGTGATVQEAYKDALCSGPTLDPNRDEIDAAVLDSVAI